MIMVILKTVMIVAIIAVFLVCFIYRFALSKLFNPQHDKEAYNTIIKRKDTEMVTIKTDDGNELHGWWYHCEFDEPEVYIYYYGNGQNASFCMSNILARINTEGKIKHDIVIVDYPEYGMNSGIITEKTMKSAGLLIYDMVASNNIDSTKISIAGYSLGTGLACYVAANRPSSKLILAAPYADGYDLYNDRVNIFYGPLKCIVAYKMESIKYAAAINTKVYIIASSDDAVVSYHSSTRLYEAFGTKCTMKTYTGVSHRELWTYLLAILINPDIIK